MNELLRIDHSDIRPWRHISEITPLLDSELSEEIVGHDQQQEGTAMHNFRRKLDGAPAEAFCFGRGETPDW